MLADPTPEEYTSEEPIPYASEEAPEQAALSDIFQDGAIDNDEEEEEEDASSIGEPEFVITWELPEVSSQSRIDSQTH